jgi:hypothetical protein
MLRRQGQAAVVKEIERALADIGVTVEQFNLRNALCRLKRRKHQNDG